MFLRRLLTYIFIFFACLASYGQVNQVLWGKGKALYANPIATIDSLTYGQLLYGDTLYIIFDRESKRIVYDTIHIHMPGIVFHDTIYTTDTIYLESGRRSGLFSVGPNQYVTFSQGNLQYTQSTDTWQFANEQWECIGAGNIKEGALADKIDLFGWSANNTTAPWGVSLSRNNADYAGEFVDWGENIINSDVPNTWRTLTNEEWEYVLNGRKNASKLRCRAQVDHVNGFVFLPDEWVCPDGMELNLEQPTTKVFTRDEWSKMENAGAVFLPAAGRIDNKKLVNFDDHGNYWSSTRINDQWVDYLAFTFSSNKLYVDHQMPIYLGRSVRLVRDTIVPKPEYVDLGLSVKWATFNVGASKPEDYGDYFAWGETEPKEEYTWETYKWGTSGKLTKYNTIDGKTVLDLDDDAAYVHWGGKWRMPTDAERDELVENCTWTWTTQNSVNGYKVTGPNGNSIFLPAGGYKGSGPDYPVGEDGLYWLGNVYKNSYAYLFTIQHEVTPPSTEGKQGTRCFGFMIRPIYDDRPPKRIGVFSVAADKQVSFSQGNLQYTQSTDEWRFAREQYEYIGAANIKDGALADKIDLFGWSANNSTAPFGISTSTNVADYAGDFVDWGTNAISDDAPNTWRTLSKDEWEYLFEKRPNALQLRSKGSIDGHRGHILLPDDWVLPEGVQFVAEPNNLTMALDINAYTQAEWSIMEEAGAVFLPAAGRRDGTTVGYLVEYSGVWSSSSTTNTNAFHTYYNYESQIIAHHWTSATSRINGRSVRLVHDTIVPETIPEPCLVVKVNDTLSINMMCVEGGTFTWGEGSALQQVTVDNYMIGQTEVTQALWKVVMETTPEDEYDSSTSGDAALQVGDSLPMAYMSWNDAQMFVERLSELTGLAFRLPTEIEWVYAAKGGQRSKGYKFAGSDILQEVAWCGTNAKGEIKQVGQLRANELGTYDMSGNVWEFCSDVLSDGKIVAHGGSSSKVWSETHLKPEYRYLLAKGYKANRLGLRLVLDTAAYKVPEPATPGKRIGVFSVAKDKQVSFSQGNLQYIQSANLWRFAENQYDYLGEENVKDGELANRIDLFGWSANNTTAPFGISTSTDAADYAGEFVDWGVNIISGDAPTTWRTLSIAEWEYLLEKRPNAANLQGIAQVNGVNGLIILPDDWVCPLGIHFVHGFHSDFGIDYFAQHQQFTLDQWIILEQSGAVFLPASKWRNGSTFTNSSEGGHYWSSTCGEISTNAHYLSFGSQEAWMNSNSLHRCFAVRLVHDTIVPQTIPDPCLVVKVNDTLSINMMCVEGGTFRMGAMEGDTLANANEKPAHEVTLTYDYHIMQTEVTQGLWETVMGEDIYDLISQSSTPDENPISTKSDFPVGYVQLNQCLQFIDRLNAITGLHFRMPTEAEWEYAARGGNKSKGYLYAGSNTLTQVAQTSLGSVAKLQPNELGIYDMSGNMAEITLDYLPDHDIGYPSASAQMNPRQISPNGNRAIRGLQWYPINIYSRISHRNAYTPLYCSPRMGFRLVLSEELDFRTIQINGSYFDMSFVKGGTFMMGSDAPSAEADEKPVHEVTLSDYYIGQTEVTQHLWKKVMGSDNNPSAKKGDNLPVTNITWDDAQQFVTQLSEMTGLYFRLPTEAEWEYAARGGQRSQGYTYAGSNDLDSVAWHKGNCTQPQAVGQKMPNELGIYDMTGNVYEFCQDWYGPYSAESQDNPTGPTSSTKNVRVCRGGAFVNPSNVQLYCRVTRRGMAWDDNRYAHGGLRIVLDLNPRPTPVTPEPEYVDLGLSVKWATFNVGASKPEDYGDYFAWGETEPKEEYTWENYKWCDGDYTKLNKYCTKEQYGIVDNQTILQLCDDAAHTKLGGNWRMPTMEECQELVNLCTWTWTTINGINGHVITGPNGNTIFLPATGAITTSGLAHAGQSGYYWINSISTTSPYNANDIYNKPSTYGINAFSRYIGRPIRPVYDDKPKSEIIWYTDEAIKGEGKSVSITNKAGFAYIHPEGEQSTELNRRYQGKRINCIRLQVAQAGTFTVSVANRDRLDSIFNIQTIMLKDPSKEPQVYHLPQTIHLQKNQVLVFANPTDQGRFYYSAYIENISFYGLIGQKGVDIARDRTLHIDAGYYCEDGENCDTLAIPEPEYVDLGLSVKWATFNVGATSPEEYGDYFAWGETEPKETYSWATYKWCDGTSTNMTKYNTIDGKTILEPEDDAAHIHWGDKWRMPTKAECQELIDSCTWEWTTSNNINGYRVTGPNGNSIFLPAGGVRIGNASYAIGEFGYYWSSSLMIDSLSHAHSIVFTPTSKSCDSDVLYRGRKIRPVYDDR